MAQPNENRRSFGVKVMSAAALGAAHGTSSFASQPLFGTDTSAEHWQRFVGQRFRVTAESGETIIAELSEVEVCQRPDPDRDASLPRRQSFSLIFRSEDPLKSDVTYQTSHPSTSEPVVLMSVGMSDHCELEAVYN